MTEQARRDFRFAALGFVLGAVIVGTLVALLRVGTDKQSGVPPIGDGSDPIVVDNSNLRIYRNLHEPAKAGGTEWSLGTSNTLNWLVGTAIYRKRGKTIAYEFCHRIVQSDVVGFFVKERKAFELRRDKTQGMAYAQPYSGHEFDTESISQGGSAVTKLKRKGNPTVTHLTHVEFDNKKLCLGTGGEPTIVAFNVACSSDESPPSELHLSVKPMPN